MPIHIVICLVFLRQTNPGWLHKSLLFSWPQLLTQEALQKIVQSKSRFAEEASKQWKNNPLNNPLVRAHKKSPEERTQVIATAFLKAWDPSKLDTTRLHLAESASPWQQFVTAFFFPSRVRPSRGNPNESSWQNYRKITRKTNVFQCSIASQCFSRISFLWQGLLWLFVLEVGCDAAWYCVFMWDDKWHFSACFENGWTCHTEVRGWSFQAPGQPFNLLSFAVGLLKV